jgi:hypothetical protein
VNCANCDLDDDRTTGVNEDYDGHGVDDLYVRSRWEERWKCLRKTKDANFRRFDLP